MKTNFYNFVGLGALAGLTNAVYMKTGRPTTQADPLPNLQANADQITISGQSSGAHNSCHMMILMSDTIKGAGCSKGGAFMSGFDEFTMAETTRQSLSTRAQGFIEELELEGKIDPTSNF